MAKRRQPPPLRSWRPAMAVSTIKAEDRLSPLVALLTCLECGSTVEIAEIASRSGYPELGPDGWLECKACGERYPIIGGTPRMLDRSGRAQLAAQYPAAAISLVGPDTIERPRMSIRERTAESFAYEWAHFGRLRAEWRKNFLDYLQPHRPQDLAGKLVLDVGAGSGRHSYQAAACGAHVVAVDLSRSIDVARRNLRADVLTVQADAERLPFSQDTFDLVMSIGVLHHLPNTQRAINALVLFVVPGGKLHLYLYWVPELSWHRQLLRLVTLTRRVTVNLPHRLLHEICYPIALALSVLVVIPYRVLRNRRRGRRIAHLLPLKAYADYPFGVLVNDQFDRFSAPIEQRFSRAQVQVMMERAGLDQVTVTDNHGWVADGARASARADGAQGRAGVSVVVTVRNDREGLRELLPGLAAQTATPDEIVIVDGGSVDGTLDVLSETAFADVPIRKIVAPGANIAAGRNVGVREAQNELIACTDAGCRPAPGWLEALIADLRQSDLVGGLFVADGETEFEKIVSLTHYPVPEELDETSRFVRLSHRLFGRQYVASRAGGRSMAFHRDVWRAVGGFPERQYAGEDQAFVRSVVDSGFTAELSRGAVVHWRPPGSWTSTARMFFLYCRGDVRSKGRSRHLLRFAAWTLGPWAAIRMGWRLRIVELAAAAAYVALPLRRAHRAGIRPMRWSQIPLAVLVKDFSQLAGAAVGLIDELRGMPQPTPQPPPGAARHVRSPVRN